MAVDADFPRALWRLYDKTGIRPEYALACLNYESGLNPALVNRIGCVGINQACPWVLTLPEGYASWTASQQLDKVVTPMWAWMVTTYGPINSGARLQQGNFYPASLAYARELDDVIVPSENSRERDHGAAAYRANASEFDPRGTKVITVRGVAERLQRAWNPRLDALVARAYDIKPPNVPAITGGQVPTEQLGDAYALRPGERARDPVLGDDYAGQVVAIAPWMPPPRDRTPMVALGVALAGSALVLGSRWARG